MVLEGFALRYVSTNYSKSDADFVGEGGGFNGAYTLELLLIRH